MQAAAGLLLSALVAAPAMAQDSQAKRAAGSAPGSALSASITAAADAAASAPSSAPADAAAADQQTPPDTAAASMSFLKSIEISGFVDMYYMKNFNKVNAQYRNFDIVNNSFSLNLAEVALEKKPTADSRAGFRLDLDYCPTSNIVASTEIGSVNGVPASTIFQNIQQAYVSYLAPEGSGLQFDFGKFVTPAGYEVIESKDNANYSRSLLFALAIPYDHMGVRATYSPTDKVTLAGYIVNGWNVSVDNNAGKTGIFSITLKPTGAFTFIENYIGGPEMTGTNKGMRNLSDTVVTYTATKTITLAGNGDFGKQGAANGVPSQTWWGVAGYLKWQANDVSSLSPRVEYLDDKDGFMTGAVQKLWEVTIGYEAKTKAGFITRLEYRHDASNEPFFVNSHGETKKGQDTVTLGFIWAFASHSL
jgi:Putative beta-barrel porin-2, OmpL-like. bbp2